MKSYLHIGIFKDLKDENIFKTARVSSDTVEWANGADIDPGNVVLWKQVGKRY